MPITLLSGKVRYCGSTDFEEVGQPQRNMADYGISTMTRKFRGAAPLLNAFMATLVQGTQFDISAGSLFQTFGQFFTGAGAMYLQTWTSDDDPVYPTVTLVYKGLLTGTQIALGSNERAFQSITVGCTSPQKATRDITYYSPQTNWKYITNTRVTMQRQKEVTGQDPEIFTSKITLADGTVYGDEDAPAGLVTALTPATVYGKLINLQSEPVFGTPFFENTEIVATVYQT